MPDADFFSFGLLLLAIAAFFAGFVDSIVGGGGLIQIPALFSVYTHVQHTILLATNKLASIVGTTSAAVQYARRVAVPWGLVLPGVVAALVGSWWGAWLVKRVPSDFMRPLVLVMLVLVAIYTFIKKDFGAGNAAFDSTPTRRNLALIASIGLTIGFYDGFFGPGTGSFFIFLLVRFVHMDFLRASVTAKMMNIATNVAALSYFAFATEILWKVAAVMAICNLAGSIAGSRMALRHGVGFVRKMFLFVVVLLIAKLSYDLMKPAPTPEPAVSRETHAQVV